MLLCPQCKTAHEQGGLCPACGERLITRERGGGNAPRESGWMHTPWGRILLGVAFAQGMWFGTRQLLKGVLLGFLPAGAAQAEMPEVVLAYQGAQALTLVLACILAAGGQRSGIFIGTMVGVCSGLLSVLLQPFLDASPSAVHLLGLPMILSVFGAVGGWIGCTYWKPIPIAVLPGQPEAQEKQARPRRKNPLLVGRIAWFRVALGSALAIGGTVSATYLFEQLIYYSGGRLVASFGMMDKIIVWEIKALALIVGGALAGANTFNGLKQGLVVALVTTSILIGVQSDAAEKIFEFVLFTAVSAFCLCVAGGWFGCQLFPPVLKIPRRPRGWGPVSI